MTETTLPAVRKDGAAQLAGSGAFAFTPQNYKEARDYAGVVANSGLCPTAYKGKPDDILVAWQLGSELGLKPLQALQGIAIINGKPSVYGDTFLAIIQNAPGFEYIKETDDGKTATCEIKRRGMPPTIRTFSEDDAKKAGLWGKQGPWSSYPARMRQMRARGFAGRDAFADALKGLVTAEEAQDYPETLATVDERTEVVAAMPKRASEVVAEAAAPILPAQGEAQSAAALPSFAFVPSKVTKSGDNVYVYDGETRYQTAHAGIGALAKAAKEGGKTLAGTYEQGDGLRDILEAKVVEA